MDRIELEKVYKEQGTIQKTAKYFGYSYGRIWCQMDKHGIPYKLERNTIKIDKAKLAKIYLATQSIRKVGKYFNISHERARKLLNKYGLCNKLVRHSCNNNFFSKDNKQSFYWAGFIAADGAVIDRRKTLELSIGLASKDRSHIEKFKKSLKATNNIGDYLIKNSKRNPKWNDVWKSEIKITSDKLCKDLERFNVVPRKSLIYVLPLWLIDHELSSHFMRGYFDGDGSFYHVLAKDKKTRQAYFNLRGTSKFLTIYRSILEKECDLQERTKDIRINSGIGVLEYGGNDIVANIAKFLYQDATSDIYLKRKRDIIKKLL
jgi:DNA-binding transcriptional regulator WhiA